MKKNFKWLGNYTVIFVTLIITAFFLGCGGGDDGLAPLQPPPAGTVVQGPVSGADVWPDKITTAAPLGNSIMDADEATFATKTDSKGKFQYKKKPTYDYINRSKGGTDTVTNKSALPMASPAGANTVTPITTMVASLSNKVEQEALKAKIESIMGSEKYDADPSKQITPAALALSKSIEAAMTIVAEAVQSAAGTGGTIATAQLDEVMATVASSIATEMAKPSTTKATLSSAANMSTMVGTATQAAAGRIVQTATNIVFTDAAALGTAVKDASSAVCSEIASKTTNGSSSESLGSNANQKIPEATIIQQIVNTINANENMAVNKVMDTIVAIEVTTEIDTVAPEVANAGTAVTPAASAANVPVKSQITISFTKPMDWNTISSATFSIVETASGTPVTATISYNSATNTAILTPAADLRANVSHTITFTTGAVDMSAKKGLANNKVWTFTTATVPDTVPPTVSISPADGATGVALNVRIEASFDKAINPASVTTSTFTVSSAAGSVPGSVKYNASTNKAEFRPALPLAADTLYTVILTNGITSVSGVALVQTSSTFSTAVSQDVVKPTVTLATSSGTTASVPITATVIATFDKAINTSTLTNANFFLKFAADGVNVPGTILWNSVDKTATFTPDAPLLNNRIYVATITTGVTDTAGNALVEQKTLTFTTVAADATGSTGGTGGTGGTGTGQAF